MVRVLLFGGSGKLGNCIQDSLSEQNDVLLSSPTHGECDVTSYSRVLDTISAFMPDIIVNCAAMIGNKECEDDKENCWSANVDSAVNIARVCIQQNFRLVHISTSSIFNGVKGNYTESDTPTPTYYYAVSKAAAEQAVRVTPNYVIVRLDFYPLDKLKYYKVFSDHYTSKVRVDVAASQIIEILRSDFIGIINIGRARESLFAILGDDYPMIYPIKIEESTLPDFPRDLSLDISLWKSVFGEGKML